MTTSLIAIANDGLRIYAQHEEGTVYVWGEYPGVDGIVELERLEVERRAGLDDPSDRVTYWAKGMENS